MVPRGRRGGLRSSSVLPQDIADVTPEQVIPREVSVQGGQINGEVPATDFPPPPELGSFLQFPPKLVEAFQIQAQNQRALQAQFQNGNAGAADQQRLADPGRENGASSMVRFKKMGPPSFKGESEPDVAENWIRETEKIFAAIRCPEEDKVVMATFTLQERADVWWSSTLRTRFAGRGDVSWREFLVAFREKFFPEHIQDQKEREFLDLSPGSMSVMEYESRFSELEKFAPHICVDDRRRAKKFVFGLKGSIRSRLVAHDHQTLSSAVRAACLQELERERYLAEKKLVQDSLPVPFARQDRKKKRKLSSDVTPSVVTVAAVPVVPVVS
uniref:Brain-specific angiogenesis inhibitor 1-associated protein 2-like protein 2 n=1 Tax=Anthurium amnicola TaxID=1678845 RepID=A0A1D1YQI9_9ARAE